VVASCSPAIGSCLDSGAWEGGDDTGNNSSNRDTRARPGRLDSRGADTPRDHDEDAKRGRSMLKLISKIFGSANDRELSKLRPHVDKINGMESGMEKLSDEQLQAKTGEFKRKLDNGDTTTCSSSAAWCSTTARSPR
jgi:hypothetical protein